MTGKLDEISVAIGEIKGRVGGLSAEIAAYRAETAIHEASATDYRKDIRKELRTVNEKLDPILSLESRMLKVEAAADSYRKFRAQVSVVVVVVTAIVAGAFNLLWYGLTHLGDFWTTIKGPPH